MSDSPSGTREFAKSWPSLLAAFLGTSLGIAALFFYSLGVFIKPLQAAFGWSRSEVSLVPLVAILCSAVLSPVIGGLADRFGPRRVGAASLLGLAFGFFLLSRTNGSFSMFLAATCVLAILGAGSSPVVFSRLVTLWFDRTRGLALGIAAAGAGVAGIVVPRLLPGFVSAHGFRAGYALLAALPLLALPAMLLLARDASTRHVAAPMSGCTPGQARAQARFWRMGLAFFLVALAGGGFIVHFIPMLSDAGFSPAQAGATAAFTGFAIIAGRLGTGVALDRFFGPAVAAALFGVSACGCVLLALLGAGWGAVAAVLVGFSFGAEVDLVAFLAARYFGLRSIGAVFGMLYACFTAGVAGGPLLAGALHDATGSYTLSLLVEGGCLAVAALLAGTLGRYPVQVPATVEQPAC
jgi:MFS family permease